MFRINSPVFVFVFVFLLFHIPVYAADPGVDEYNKGVAYFKDKKYYKALIFFKQASKAGMNKSSLYFNLGVTSYKLKNYKRSEYYFKNILKDTHFRQIALHNLGLVAEKRNKKNIAVRWYRQSVENNTSRRITYLSNKKLEYLTSKKKKSRNNINASIRVALGYNDNVTNEALNSPSNKKENYKEVFGYLKLPVSNRINFVGMLYKLNYDRLSTEDFILYSEGVDYTIRSRNWKFISKFTLTQSLLNNISFQNIVGFKVTGQRNLQNNARLKLYYQHSNIQSKNVLYNYLQGDRHQLISEYKKKTVLGYLRLRYKIEVNQLQNTLTANYSPTRHSLRTRLKQNLKNNWTLSEEVAYRVSKYETVSNLTRIDSRLRLQFMITRALQHNWSIGIRYNYTKNNSNVSNETYSRNNINTFLSWNF